MFQPSIDVVAWPGLGPTGVWVVRPAVPCQTTYFLAVVWWIHWFVLSAYGMMFIVSSSQGPVLAASTKWWSAHAYAPHRSTTWMSQMTKTLRCPFPP